MAIAAPARPGRAIWWALSCFSACLFVLCFGSSEARAAACPNETIRGQQGATYLPECRAYELVSPADKRGGSVNFGGEAINGPTLVSPDGSSVLYPSYFAFADAEGVTINSYRATRGGDGWTSVNVSATPGEADTLFTEKGGAQDASDDLSTALFFTQRALDPLDEGGFPPFSGSLDIYARQGSGPFEWVSRPDVGGAGPGAAGANFVGRSADAQHIVFESREPLAPPPSGEAPVAGTSVFERFQGRTTLVNVGGSGTPTSECGAVGLGISADGRRVAFGSPTPAESGSGCEDPSRLYLRVDGDRTIEISAPQVSPAPAPGSIAPDYKGMSRDGSHVFFNAAVKLTPDGPEGVGLYSFDTTTETLSSLGGFGNVLAISADGRRLLIERPGSGLVFAEDGMLEPVASFAGPGDSVSTAAINPSGSRVAFVTTASLAGANTGANAAVYTFSPLDGVLTCASCGSGVPSGAASLGGGSSGINTVNPAVDRNVSADGSVFFTASQRLAPGDANDAPDVYEWHQGSIHLLSGGAAGTAAYFAGASVDGGSVVFSTSGSLVPQDTDGGAKDLYAARVGGGYLAPATERQCREEECQGQPSSAPASTPVASAGLLMPAGTTARRTCRPQRASHAKKKSAHAKKKAAKRCWQRKKHHPAHRAAGRSKEGNR